MESRPPSVGAVLPPVAATKLDVTMLGAFSVRLEGAVLALPASRKVRALLAYLLLSPEPVSRSRLCELLWDVPNDPRGELRWCLSKIRKVLDTDGGSRVVAGDDRVGLDRSAIRVDAIEAAEAVARLGDLGPDRLEALGRSLAGDFLDGLEIDRSPLFDNWLVSQRRRFRAARIAILERLVSLQPGEDALAHLETWLELAPFDARAHAGLLALLARRGSVREGEEHLAAAERHFEAEGLDAGALRTAWRTARERRPAALCATVAAAGETCEPAPLQETAAAPRRASVAVMPFADRTQAPGTAGGMGGAFAHDIITRLAKLRVLFVIAQGTVLALRDRDIGAEAAGRMLDVDYVVHGALHHHGGRLSVLIELVETRTARIVWSQTFARAMDDAFLVIEEIGDGIVASIASEIETMETQRAILRPPASLDAWEAHHCGLWHMYRFNEADNIRAREFFERAVRLDPTFSRAFAGLSFTHFQTAFQGWEGAESAAGRAYDHAGESLVADDRDPAAHWAFGRALWLHGRHGEAARELEQSVDLSPNFALAHYTLAFFNSQRGDPEAAILSADHSRGLSPFDPMLFAMFGARAMALARLGRFEAAAEWGIRAASRPNAHAHILAIAGYGLGLAGRLDEARGYLAAIRRTRPTYGVDDFLMAMRFGAGDEGVFRAVAAEIDRG